MTYTLSQVMAWDTSHLEEAAAHWTATANTLDDAFTMAYRQVQSPGGTVWEGPASNAAAEHVGMDLRQVRGGVEAMYDASLVARNGADDISWAKQQAMSAVANAEEDGFTVGEDLSVTEDWTGLAPALAAKRAELAQEHRESIHDRVGTLVDTDHQVASRINGHAEAVGFTFKEDGPTPDPTPQMRPEPGSVPPPPVTDPTTRARLDEQQREIDELRKKAGQHGSIGGLVGAGAVGCATGAAGAAIAAIPTGPLDPAIAAGACAVGAAVGGIGYLGQAWVNDNIDGGSW